MPCLVLAMIALCAPAVAQSDIVATVSRTVELAPDQITFFLAIMTDPDVTLDQVLQASQPLGLTARDLLGISSQQFGPGPSQTRLAYTFEYEAQFSKFKEANDKMASLRRTLAANTPAMEVQVYSISVSPADAAVDQARQGAMTQLFADAKQRADQMAKAGGVSIGSVVGVSEGVSNAANQNGYFYGPYGPIGPGTLRTTFTLTVRYAIK